MFQKSVRPVRREGGLRFGGSSAPSGGRAGCARGENRTSLESLRRFSLDLASPALPPDGATLPLLRGGVCARATISRTVQDPSIHRPRSSARAPGGQCTSRNFVHPCMKIKVSCTDIALMYELKGHYAPLARSCTAYRYIDPYTKPISVPGIRISLHGAPILA